MTKAERRIVRAAMARYREIRSRLSLAEMRRPGIHPLALKLVNARAAAERESKSRGKR